MDEIFVAVVKVSGTSETINRAMQMASDVIRGQAAPVEIAAAPVDAPALPIAAPAEIAAGKFRCKHCPASFESVGKVAAHTRMTHPKNPKPPAVAAVETPKPAEAANGKAAKELFWCPQKNCAASFSKERWRTQHLKWAHGITV